MLSHLEYERAPKRSRYDDDDSEVEDESSSMEVSESENETDQETEQETDNDQDIADQLESATSRIGEQIEDLDIISENLKTDVRRLEKCVDLIFKKIKEMNMYIELAFEAGNQPATTSKAAGPRYPY